MMDLLFFGECDMIAAKGVRNMLYLGCHLSASAGNLAMVETARSIGSNTFALFTLNPLGSKANK